MEIITMPTAIFALISLSLALIAAYSRRDWQMRLLAVLLGVAFIPVTIWTLGDLLGRPRVVAAEKLHAPGACMIVLDKEVVEKVGIYLLVKDRASPWHESRYLFVPWDVDFALSLQWGVEGKSTADASGMLLLGDQSCHERELSLRGGGSATKSKKRKLLPGTGGGDEHSDGDVMFYADPIPPPPQKPSRQADTPSVSLPALTAPRGRIDPERKPNNNFPKKEK